LPALGLSADKAAIENRSELLPQTATVRITPQHFAARWLRLFEPTPRAAPPFNRTKTARTTFHYRLSVTGLPRANVQAA
jgi:hypothetical protein